MFTAASNTAAVQRDESSSPKVYRVYIAAATETEFGVACLDFSVQKSCGFTPSGPLAVGHVSKYNQVAGGAQIGTKFYLSGPEARIHCFDYSTDARCSGFPSAGIPGTTYTGGSAGYFYQRGTYGTSLRSFDDRYVFASFVNSTESQGKDLSCLDTRTNTICPGFPITNVSTYYDVAGEHILLQSSLAPVLNPGGQLTGVCAAAAADHNSMPYKCFSLSGTAISQPWPTQSGEAGFVGFDGVMLLGKKLYFAMSANPTGATPGAATYTGWDFATSADCAGFTSNSSGANVSPYTLRQDPYEPTCIWEVGDTGVFEVFHRDTGQLGSC